MASLPLETKKADVKGWLGRERREVARVSAEGVVYAPVWM